MTDRVALPAMEPASLSLAARRLHARRAADRHSAHVRLLRRGMIAGAVALVIGIVVVVVVDPFRGAVSGLSIESTALDGTKVTMINPKLSGFQKDGRPYAIEAAKAVQDIKAPTLFELHDLKARLVMVDKSVTNLTAPAGSYNSVAETMQLGAGAHVVSETGLDVTTQDALVEFKTNALTTDKPVSVTMPGKHIAADGMRIRDGGKSVTFEGHVHSEFIPVQQTAAVDGTVATPAP